MGVVERTMGVEACWHALHALLVVVVVVGVVVVAGCVGVNTRVKESRGCLSCVAGSSRLARPGHN